MPRPYILSNGRLFIGIDERYRIRDLFWPLIGQHNHLSGQAIRLGIWVDGVFSWIESDDWQHEVKYSTESFSLVGQLTNTNLGVCIELTDEISADQDVLSRHLHVINLRDGRRPAKLFHGQAMDLFETDIGDTAFLWPDGPALVHFKDRAYFAFGSSLPISSYACGQKGFGGLDGTWRDAEDGALSGNPIAQGSVDSVFSVDLELTSQGQEVSFWMVAAFNLVDLRSKWQTRITVTPATLPTGPDHLENLSIAIVQAHQASTGAILAALDSDIMETNRANYAYCWMRDGATLSDFADGNKFFEFAESCLRPNGRFFLQKYLPNGSFGATWHPWVRNGISEVPYQEDETALVVLSACDHFAPSPPPDFIRECAQALATSVDPDSCLPLPSYDLWEERHGVHFFTSCAVVAALRAAAIAFDDHSLQGAADQIRDAIPREFVKDGRYVRSLNDDVIDASMLQGLLLGVFGADDAAMAATIELVRERLSVASDVGGLARYEGDYYFRQTEAYPGNPWIISTLWLAQVDLMLAKDQASRDAIWAQTRSWIEKHSRPAGILPEQLHPQTGAHLSVSPLAWSHGEYVKTAQIYRSLSEQ